MSSFLDIAATRDDDERDDHLSDANEDQQANGTNGDTRRDEENSGSDIDSSEEESDDDEEEARRIREGFIVEDEDPERAERRRRKRNKKKRKHREDADGENDNERDERRHHSREDDEELDEDDLELLMESGQERTLKKLKRVQENDLANMFDEDEELEDEVEVDDRPAIGRGGEFDDFIEDDLSEDEIDRVQREQQERFRSRGTGRQELTADSVGMDADAFQDVIDVFGNGEDYLDALQSEDDEAEQEVQRDGPDLKKLFEPSDLASRMLTDADEIIRMTDEPERMQLARGAYRDAPIDEDDFEYLCSWMTNQLWPRFVKKKATDHREKHKDNPNLEALHAKATRAVMTFYTRESLEIPYIWNHRREYLQCKDEREADIADNERSPITLIGIDELWNIYNLEVRFRSILDKRNAIIKTYKSIEVTDDVFDKLIASHAINEMQDVLDLHDYLQFQYAENLRDAQAASTTTQYKRPTTKISTYAKARRSPIYSLVRLFGITSQQFAENFAEGNKRHYADDPEDFPEDIAENFVSEEYLNAQVVLDTAKMMFAEELLHNPIVRRTVRAIYVLASDLSIRPTKKGIKEIDEFHPFYAFKYAEELDLEQLRRAPSMILQILKAESEGLITLAISLRQESDLIAGIETYIVSDNFSDRSEQWNSLRKDIIARMFAGFKSSMIHHVIETIRSDAEDAVAQECRKAYATRLNQRPPKVDRLQAHEIPRVLAISNGAGTAADAIVSVFVDEKGRMREHRKFRNLRDEENKTGLKQMIETLKIDLIALAGFSPALIKLRGDIDLILTDINHTERPSVHYVNDEVARLYQNSPRAQREYPALGPAYRYCIAIGHYLQSPIHEYAALGEEVKQLTWHPQQGLVPAEKIRMALESAMVDMVNLIGVDINKAQDSVYEENLLQYVSGLGPRKANYLKRRIAQSGGSLDSRTELLEKRFITRNIFVNCASAIRFRFSLSRFQRQSRREDGSSGMDILDETRIHPEDYDLANKMAADAQDLDEEDTAAIEGGPVLLMREKDAYDRLEDLILEDYAEELFKAFNQPKLLTLQLIARELANPYAELRQPFHNITEDELFLMLTGETEKTAGQGQIMSAKIMRASDTYLNCRSESGLDVDVNVEDTGLPSDAKLTNHFNVGDAVRGVVLQLDKSAFRVHLALEPSRIESALRDQKRAIVQQRQDIKWADKQEREDQATLKAAKEALKRSQRVIKHPLFKQFNARQAEEYLGGLPRGEAVIRPSSKGNDHIAITWKIADGIFQHLDVLELDKDSTRSIGTRLKVGNAIYGDLDELLVSHVRAMAKKIDEMSTHDKFQRGTKADTEQYLTKYSEANPRRSCYAFCFNHAHPGYFDLCFKANPKSAIGEWSVKVIPNAFAMKENVYADMTQLCNGFKMLFAGQSKR